MPASQAVDVFRGLTVEVKPVDEEPDVFFTDQSPKFKLIVRNVTDYNFVEGSELTWYLAIGPGMPEPVYKKDLSIEVPTGEKREYEIGGELLAFDGHGVVGVLAGGASGRGEPDYELRSAGALNNYEPAYTFSVWDRSYYKSAHEHPQKLQKIAIFATGAIVLFSLVQLVITLL